MKFTVLARASRQTIALAAMALCGLSAQADVIRPLISVNDVSIAEGNSGSTNVSFRVSLNTVALLNGVSFDLDVVGNTATANVDFASMSVTGLRINQGSDFFDVNVEIYGDTDFEANETFNVNLSNIVGADAFDIQGLGTILNDDVRQQEPPGRVPEPSSAALIALGLGAAGGSRAIRRRR